MASTSSQPASPLPAGINWVGPGLLDCLSLSFSFLKIREFARAMRCSQAWLAVGRKRTAWPRTCIDTIWRSVEAASFDLSGARRASVNVNRTSGRRGLQRACHSPVWSQLADIHIWSGKTFHRQQQQQQQQVRTKLHDDDVLRAIFRLPLKALNLGLTRPSCQMVHECFTRISSTLECLISNEPTMAVVGSLHLLVHLSALVIKVHRDGAPVQPIGSGPASQLARALSVLHELQSLHYDDRNVDALMWVAPVQLRPDQEQTSPVTEAREVLTAVRKLSVEHRLRNLSIHWRSSVVACRADVLDLSPLGDAPLTEVQLDTYVPTAANLLALVALPALCRLTWRCCMTLLADVIQHAAPPPQQASALRSLRLHHHESDQTALYPLVGQGVLAWWAACAPALQQLNVSGARMRTSDWYVLPEWSQLKELRMCAPLELSVESIRLLEGWSSWQTIDFNPSRRPSAACGCNWSLTRRRMQRGGFWTSGSPLRLHQTSPPTADEHGHATNEYELRSQRIEMTDDGSTPVTAWPEWQPIDASGSEQGVGMD